MLRTGLEAPASSRYQVLGPLGSGGFGAVYEAVDSRSGQRVALKELDNLSAENIARFKQEFRALSDCHHPNLVGLKELIEQNGRWLIVMELVPGADLRSYVRGAADNDNGGRYDEARLRHAFLGMAHGLIALHGYGVVHRDLKPSNVRVTPEGRAVLLDFGLVTSVDPSQQSTHALTLGTVAYMAPEQAKQKALGPSADWYAFGVCLFEALTGRVPFSGETAFQILTDKQQLRAPLASSLEPSVPPDLDALCASLLKTDPELRAGARDVLRVLGEVDSEVVTGPLLVAPSRAPFAGRDAELSHLGHALARTDEGELRLVLVEGESGVGKSELVAEFLRRERERTPRLVALRGRCYENEQVAYKAFDGCIDELARLLRRLPEQECAMLLPPRAALLGQLFPVLRTLSPIAKAPRGDLSADPTARRLEAFEALAILFTNLAEERPVVLVVDDLQWADSESFRLLLALAERPAPPPLLIVATIRPHEELEPELLAQLEAVRRRKHIDVVPVRELPPAQAEALALKLSPAPLPAEALRVIVDESGGHPLFLSELVQFAQSHDPAARGALTLGLALRTRIDRLDKRARELLEIVALAARPHGSHIFARALGVDNIDEPARSLLAAKLLRLRKGQELGCYHDRIRHSAVARIARSRLAALHRQLAGALASDPSSDPTEQAHHWDLAGDEERAVEAYERAAQSALAALAFVRAAQLCARAMELVSDERDERWQKLVAQRAHALACAGRSAEAVAQYERAMARARGETRVLLRTRYAQQLILSGKIDQGFDAARALLREQGVPLPLGAGATLLQILWIRLWLALRGARFTPRPARAGDEPRARAIELINTFVNVLAPFHPMAIMALSLCRLRLVAATPLPAGVVGAYASLAWFRCLGGRLARAVPLFDKARAICAELRDPVVQARLEFVEGSARLMGWDWSGGSACLERAQDLLQAHCPDEPSLLTLARYNLGFSWHALGEHSRLAREAERWLAEARERNDQAGVALLVGMGHGFVRHLMHDAPDEALRELDEAIGVLPAEPFSFVHFGHVFAVALSLLYRGGSTAHEWFERQRAAHTRPLLLRSRMAREPLRLFRCCAALHAHDSAPPEQQAALRRALRKSARRLARSRAPLMRVHGRLLLAQVSVLEGAREAALREARAARALADNRLQAAVYLEALLETGDARDPRCQRVLSQLRAQGWRDPLRFLSAMLPLAAQLTPRSLPARAAGLVLDRYEIVRPLGSGFGSVFEVRDVVSGQSSALKELVRTHGRSLESFKREFRALSELHHANLVRLDALFEHAGTWYIAMELVNGPDLVSYARPEGQLDAERLRLAFAGAVEGLAALHQAGLVHRDVKPQNVRVAGEGRAVLLDFALCTRAGAAGDVGRIGTPAYAAPEQLAGAVASEAADVYALGVCLYEALSGRLPYTADTPALLAQAKAAAAPPLSVSGCEQLVALALRMLAPSPEQRPALGEVRAALRPPDQRPVHEPWSGHDEPHVQFAGREAELARLSAAFERTCDDGLTLTFVEGESGVGKSALLSEFERRVSASFPGLLVLKSRCYENEQIAFKAFDGAIDQLAQALRALSSPVCEGLLPKRAALLGQLFPVLTDVPAIAHAPKKGLPADPGMRRAAAIHCIVELLERLASRFELLLLIEDLQWADGESLRLFRTLVARREHLPFLIVASVRPAGELAPEVAQELGALRASGAAEDIALRGLSEQAAAALAVELCGAPVAPERMRRLLQESKGHPLFLRELIAQAQGDSRASGASTLDEALRARMLGFEPDARRLLTLVALAERPYPAYLFARALGTGELPRAALVGLLGRGLLRRGGDRQLACYHDRIRRVALGLLAPDERRALARRLAQALDGERGADPAERARLWDEAGEHAEASLAYAHAGDRAYEGLAFARAAQHYQRARELLGDRRDERWRELLVRRGHALVSAGQSADAARVFRQAAEAASGEAAVELRILAAQHLILSAQVDEGLRAARALLGELGIPVPASPGAALARLAWDRGLVALRRGTASKRREQPSPRKRMQLDAAWLLGPPISWLDPLTGAALNGHHLRLALAAGEPVNLSRALGQEAFSRVLQDPNDPAADELLTRARALADEQGEVELDTMVTFLEGTVATYRWQLERAADRLLHALELAERCHHMPWVHTYIRTTLGSVWMNRAEHARLAAASSAWIADARERRDQFALTTLNGLGYGFLPALMADEPERAQSEIERQLAVWPREPFSFAHLGELVANSYRLLYAGGAGALAWYERELPRLSRGFLLRASTGKGILFCFRALAALSAWTVAEGVAATRLLAQARALTDELGRMRSAFAQHNAPFLTAQLSAVEGSKDEARHTAQRVQRQAEQCGYAMLAHRAAYLDALLAGDDSGRETRARLLAFYAGQGWRQPRRAFSLWCPVIDVLEPQAPA